MNLPEAIAPLKLAAPALATKETIPAFTHFRFDGETVTASAGDVAIITACELPIDGCLPGRLLLDFLSASRLSAKAEISIEQDDTRAVFKVGRARLTLDILPDEEFPFEPPDEPEDVWIEVDEGLLAAISAARPAMGVDEAQAWGAGLAIFCDGTVGTVSADNNFVMVEADFLSDVELDGVLPPRFVDLFLTVAKSCIPEWLYVGQDWIIATYSDGTWVVGRAPADQTAAEISGFMDSVPWNEDDWSDSPARLLEVVKHSIQILRGLPEPVAIFVAKGGRLRVKTKAIGAQLNEVLPLAGHEDARVITNPNLITPLLERASWFRIIPDQCIAIMGELDEGLYVRYMVAILGED